MAIFIGHHLCHASCSDFAASLYCAVLMLMARLLLSNINYMLPRNSGQGGRVLSISSEESGLNSAVFLGGVRFDVSVMWP
ncbi:unnamed protein product [Victoria cruziana]